jgi:hypothetical protein
LSTKGKIVKQYLWRIVFLVNVFVGICVLRAEGFVAGTLVHTQQGYVPIEQYEAIRNIDE